MRAYVTEVSFIEFAGEALLELIWIEMGLLTEPIM